MDCATVVGLVAGIAILAAAAGNDPGAFAGAAVPLVALGGLAATLVAFPLREFVSFFGAIPKVFAGQTWSAPRLIERLVGLAETARRQGILALEHTLHGKDDPFLAMGIRLAVDGTEPDLIMDIMETELRCVEKRHAASQEVAGSLARGWLAFGALTALGVLVSARSSGMPAMGVTGAAALPLFVGLAAQALVARPFRQKLARYSSREILAKRMIIEGVMAIQSGDNPRIVEHKLSVFLQPGERPAPEPAPARPPTRPFDLADESGSRQVSEYTAANQPLILRVVREAADRADASADEKAAVQALLAEVDGGQLPVIAMLSRLGQELRREVERQLANPPVPLLQPGVAAARGYVFEDLAGLTDREVQTLLREVDQKDLVVALTGASPALRHRVLGNMSERVRTFILEEMAYLGPLPPGQVLACQARIVGQAEQLRRAGQLG